MVPATFYTSTDFSDRWLTASGLISSLKLGLILKISLAFLSGHLRRLHSYSFSCFVRCMGTFLLIIEELCHIHLNLSRLLGAFFCEYQNREDGLHTSSFTFLDSKAFVLGSRIILHSIISCYLNVAVPLTISFLSLTSASF